MPRYSEQRRRRSTGSEGYSSDSGSSSDDERDRVKKGNRSINTSTKRKLDSTHRQKRSPKQKSISPEVTRRRRRSPSSDDEKRYTSSRRRKSPSPKVDKKKISESPEKVKRSQSPEGFGGIGSSSGELESSGDEKSGRAVQSTVRRTATGRLGIERPPRPPRDSSSSSSSDSSQEDGEKSPSPKRSKHDSDDERDKHKEKPDWARRSWSPEDRRKRPTRHRRSHSRDRRDRYDDRHDRRRSPDDRRRNYRDDRREYGRRDDDRRRDDRRRDERRDDRRRDTGRDDRRGNKNDDEEKENVLKNDDDTKPESPAPRKPKEDTLMTRTGGAYIPPARLRMMQQAIQDKTSVEYQRMSWEALKKSINGLVNKVNVTNIADIVRELFEENIVRGRGLLCRSIIQAQSASPSFTHVYAALVSIINSKFPQIGELLLKRLVLQFRRGFRRNDKAVCISSTQFIAHLVNQVVAHEILALEVLTLLLEKATDDSVEIAVGFMKESGQKLTDVSPRGVNAIFERFRSVLHEAQVNVRVQYMVEVLFAVRKDKFKDHVAVPDGLDLIEEDDQFTHMMTLEDDTQAEEMLNIFKVDENFAESEAKYKELKKEILDQSDSGSDDESGSGTESESEEEEDQKQTIIDQTETNIVGLRRNIYLTLQSSLDYEEAAHKMLRLNLKPGQEIELCNMVLDCCAQQRTYEKFYGLLAQRFCALDKKYVEPFEQMFMDQYETCHRLDPTKLRNVSKFFGHLLHTDAISWGVLQVIHMNEDETTSSSRIFVKSVFLELAEYMGLPKLNARLRDETLQQYFEGIMPRDHPKKTRFAINFFTSIGLGGLTDGLRDHLKNAPRPAPVAQPSSSDSSDSSSDSDSDSSSSSDSDSD